MLARSEPTRQSEAPDALIPPHRCSRSRTLLPVDSATPPAMPPEQVTVMNDGLLPSQSTEAVSDRSQFEDLCISCQAICETLERWTLKCPLFASILWMGLLFTIVLSVYTPAYETNDDVAMSMIAAGTGIAAQPGEHLVYTSVVIGLLLKQLYTQMPSTPWHGISLLAVHFLSHVAILYAVLKWRYSRAAVFCYTVLFATAGVLLITRLQFTSTAIWCVECGLFLALNGLSQRRDAGGRGGWGMLASGAALIIWGSLVRFDSYIAAMAISAIPLSVLVWQQDRSTVPGSRVWRIALAMIVLIQFPVFGLHAAHQRYYARDPAWQEYLQFNRYRTQINDYVWTRYTEESQPVFDQVQWSENDYHMILGWYFDDPLIFGRQNLQAIMDGYDWPDATVSPRNMFHWWIRIVKNSRLWSFWALIPLQFWWSRDRRFAIRHFLLLTLSLDALICGLMFLKEPPERVYFALIAFQALYLLSLMRYSDASTESPSVSHWFCSLSLKRDCDSPTVESASPVLPPDDPATGGHGVMRSGTQSPRIARTAWIAMAILGMLLGQSMAFRNSRKALSANRRLHADLARISPSESELFVCWGIAFPLESILPLESPDLLRNRNLLWLSWLQQSPVNDAAKGRFGIQDLPLALLDNPNVYLIANTPELAFYRTYFREHYHLEVDWDLRFEGSEFNVYKPVRRGADKGASTHLRKTRKTTMSGAVSSQIRANTTVTDF